MLITALHEAISAIAPIDGMSIGSSEDRSTWRIDFKPEATEEQRSAAEAAKLAFVPPAERRLVPKSVIINRLTDAQLDAALAMMTSRQKERWRASDQPAVYADDPETLAVLKAVGTDPSAVLAP